MMASTQINRMKKKERRRRPDLPTGAIWKKYGQYSNADLFLYHDAAGGLFILKTFENKHVLVRNSIGRFLIRREARALEALSHLPGIPADVRRTGPFSLVMRQIAGQALSESGLTLSSDFLIELERRIEAIHGAGYAHLDLRNLGNIICGEDRQPYIIDFQSSIKLAALPPLLRRQARDTDLSAVCKAWQRCGREPLDRKHAEFIERFRKGRRFWVFQGYFFSKALKRLGLRRS